LCTPQNIIHLNKSERTRAVHVPHVEQKRNAYVGLVGLHGRKRPLGRPRYRWGHKLKMYLGRYRIEGYGPDLSGFE